MPVISRDYSKEELETSTVIYDKLSPLMEKKAKDSNTFRKFRLAFSKILDRNREKLQTNIIGKQVLINAKDEESLLDALDITKEESEEILESSPFFMSFGGLKLINQYIFAVPIIVYSQELNKLGKLQEAQLSFLSTFIKPYASRESLFFKYGVNEDQMMYTIENMTDRFDIKKLGSIINVLTKKSAASFDNYFIKTKKKFTDKEIYTIYSSGVASSVNNMLNKVNEEYRKNDGKYLAFENSATSMVNDDGEDDFGERNIASDAEIKTGVVNRIITEINKNPVNTKALNLACIKGFGSASNFYTTVLRTAIEEITDKMFYELPTFFSCLIGSFLFNDNPTTGKRYTMTDFKSPMFIKASLEIFKKPHTDDKNMLKVKELMNKMLTEHSTYYINWKTSQQTSLKNALYFYWILIAKLEG